MSEPSGDPVEQLAARNAGAQPTREFADKAPPPDLGDPAADYPGTVRVEWWEHRYRTAVRRAVKTTRDGGWAWVLFCGPVAGQMLDDRDVSTWPVCPSAVTHAAYAVVARRAGEAAALPVQDAERGDMDVKSFRG